MRYTVTWIRSALDELADIWTVAPDRQAVTDAADAIDTELAIDPITKGLEVSEGLYALFVPPLRILFSISEQDRIVEVARVKHI